MLRVFLPRHGGVGRQKGRGLGGRNFCPLSLFRAAAEFRILLRKMRRKKKKCCHCPNQPVRGQDIKTPYIIILQFGI
jgi:hypothetical protein